MVRTEKKNFTYQSLYLLNEPEITKRVCTEGACFMFETEISFPKAFSTTLCTTSLPLTSSTIPIRPSKLPEKSINKVRK